MNIPATKCRVLWSAPEPRHTFGDEICDRVLEVDPEAVVIDTHAVGRKDLVALAYKLYAEERAEAIFFQPTSDNIKACISIKIGTAD